MRRLLVLALVGCGGGGESPAEALADLRVAATAPLVAEANGPVEYTVTVTNDGPEDANGVVVTHTMTAGFVEAIQAPEISCVQTTNTEARCQLPQLTVGTTASFMVLARAPSSGPFASTTQAFAVGVDPDPINNSLILTTDVIARADLQVFINTFTTNTTPGGVINYDLFALNNGPSPGSNGVLLVQPTGGLTLTQVEVPGWTCSGSPDITCTIPLITVGGFHQVIATGTAPAQAGTCALMFTLSSDTIEQFPGDNVATAMTTVN
jgi:uncharacterized repeat protein (TIGR01451 family)